MNYKNYIVLDNIFSDDEIHMFQECLGDGDGSKVPDCFTKYQSIILFRIKDALGVDTMSVGMARISNNNNIDAQHFHRDVKLKWNHTYDKYPDVYTVIIYFDNASLLMGNDIINSKPGDVIVFNSTNLHKAHNILSVPRRRVLQYFHVFFDENERNNFYKHHSFCENDVNIFFRTIKFLRIYSEYYNLSRVVNNSNCNKELFMTNIKESSYITTIDGIKYYNYF
jgi:hypothetical protein